MYCINCGNELPEGANHCPYCGASTKNLSDQIAVKNSEKSADTQKSKNLKVVLITTAVSAVVAIAVIVSCALLVFKPSKKSQFVSDSAISEEHYAIANERPSFLESAETVSVKDDLTPSVEEYSVNRNFKDVSNGDRYYFSDEAREMLAKNLFVVNKYGGREFYTEYEMNRYSQRANFVTVDSLMHTYHVYFAYLLKSTEKNYLYDNLASLSKMMKKESYNQYKALVGTEWEDAAYKNLAFFSIGETLIDEKNAEIYPEVEDLVTDEVAKIMAADGIEICDITGLEEDYTQYIPRGYYDGDRQLEAYFRAMMWYGRIAFKTESEETNRCALLMTLAMRDTDLDAWSAAYEITSFFAGASDDLGYYEYMPIIEEIYGAGIESGDLPGKDKEWKKFAEKTKKLDPPQINSIPVDDGENPVIASFRFMGQRFSIDADVMQKLIYSSVKENSSNEKRMLPDVLDVACALGSDTAEDILRSQGDFDYKGYEENMAMVKSKYEDAPASVWKSTLYASWLYTLTPLLKEAPEGYPSYMRSENWNKKNLETFAGSYTELKHDTVLYSKQIMAEMGGGDDEIIDDRGFVDPQVEVYARFANLSRQTAQGLDNLGMLKKSDKDSLEKLALLAEQLLKISEKELENQTLTDDEYDLIRNYGGNIEHFWKEAMREITGEENPNEDDFPAALVTDIATDPNGKVLEIATGQVHTIYVIAPVDGQLKICSGGVYSFYQFPWDMSDRLTDNSWRQMMGIEMTDSGDYNWDSGVEQPKWTQSYRPE